MWVLHGPPENIHWSGSESVNSYGINKNKRPESGHRGPFCCKERLSLRQGQAESRCDTAFTGGTTCSTGMHVMTSCTTVSVCFTKLSSPVYVCCPFQALQLEAVREKANLLRKMFYLYKLSPPWAVQFQPEEDYHVPVIGWNFYPLKHNKHNVKHGGKT